MTVTVTNFEKSLETGDQYDAVIGLLDKRAKQWQERGLAKFPNRKMFWFDDVVYPYHDGPTQKDIEEIVAHIHEKDLLNIEKKVLVHCFAGISRSTATAIGLLFMRGSTADQAVEQIWIQRSRMRPNEDVLRHFDTVLNTGGQLEQACRAWKQKQRETMNNTPYLLFDMATENPEKM